MSDADASIAASASFCDAAFIRYVSSASVCVRAPSFWRMASIRSIVAANVGPFIVAAISCVSVSRIHAQREPGGL